MGARKRESANRRKEALKTQYFAKLNNVPTSPRKMRLAADMVRGMEVFAKTGKTVAFCHCQLGAKERTQSRKRRTLHLYNLCGLCSDA